MSYFIHPNVMPLIGLCFDGEMPLLIMPLMSKGNVLEYVKRNKVDLNKDQEASEVEVHTCSCMQWHRNHWDSWGLVPPLYFLLEGLCSLLYFLFNYTPN